MSKTNLILYTFIILVTCSLRYTQSRKTQDQLNCHLINTNFILFRNISCCSVQGPLQIHRRYLNYSKGINVRDVPCFSAKDKDIWYFPLGIDEIFPNLTVLEVAKSKLREISRISLGGFNLLESIDFSGNNIKNLEVLLFSGNPRLTYIDMSNNPITVIHPTAFHELKYLEYLNLLEINCYSDKATNHHEVRELIESSKILCSSAVKYLQKNLRESQNSLNVLVRDNMSDFSHILVMVVIFNVLTFLVVFGGIFYYICKRKCVKKFKRIKSLNLKPQKYEKILESPSQVSQSSGFGGEYEQDIYEDIKEVIQIEEIYSETLDARAPKQDYAM